MRRFLTATLLAWPCLSTIQAQPPERSRIPDLTVPEMMAELRRSGPGNAAWVSEILCQVGGVPPNSKREELVDSLMMRAMTRRDPNAHTQSVLAISALLNAAKTGVIPECRPLPRVFERLERVFRESPESGAKSAALHAMLGVPERARVLAFLKEVAISTAPQVSTAVDALMQAAGEQSYRGPNSPGERAMADAILRELYEKDLVKDGPVGISPAATQLFLYGRAKGWVKR